MRATRLLTTTLLALGLATTSGAGATAVPPDDTVPVIAINAVQWQKVFPADDGYRDSTRISYVVTDAVDTTVDVSVVVTDSTDTVVGETVRTAVPTSAEALLRWDGSDFLGTSLPAGGYTLTFTATDAAGNTSVSEARTLTVDEGELVDRTFKGSIAAKRSIVEKEVRRCGDLRSPVRGWAKSLGYYANARCNRSGLASVAATVNGMYVPKAFKDADRGSFYKNITVKTWGGNARQRPGAESILQYWNYADQKWFADRTMGSRVGNHAGATKGAKPMVVPGERKPYVIWSLLTANGHWYDVKKFSVVLKYQVMKRPVVARTTVPTGAPTGAPTGVSVTAPQLP
jgi:hypothetical protein